MKQQTIIDVLIDSKLAKSISEAKRFIKERAVEYDNKLITENIKFIPKKAILRVGKKPENRRMIIPPLNYHWERIDRWSAKVVMDK